MNSDMKTVMLLIIGVGWLVPRVALDGADLALEGVARSSEVSRGSASEIPAVDEFLERLSKRYHGLAFYRDQIVVQERTQREGDEPTYAEMHAECVVRDGVIDVETPASEVLARVGPGVSPRQTPLMKQLRSRHHLWRAPHLGLAICDIDLTGFREGVVDGFDATGLELVRVNDRDLWRLQLESRRAEAAGRASFGLYVNPDSMLVERVEGEQELADGIHFETRIDITPLVAISIDEREQPGGSASVIKVSSEPDVVTGPVRYGEAPLL